MAIRIEHALEETSVPQGAKKLFVKSYGCQMNVYDGLRISELMKPHGYHLVSEAKGADMAVFNTCHIREKADEKLFSDIGRVKRVVNEDAILAVGGCIGQAMGKKVIQRSPAVRVVFGPQTYHRLPEFVAKIERGHKRVVDTDFPALEKFDNLPTPGNYGPTAFVTIQEGCNKFCTYCVVPYTRGEELSRSAVDILEETRTLAAQGTKEISLLGQNVNAYHGVDENGVELSLAGLIKEVAKIDGIERIRFTTSHPNNMQADLIDLFGTEEKLMPYLHLPVQSGSNKILHAMNRNHTAEDYLDIIEKVRAIRPDIAISGDFIVGFPGETEQDYMETLELVAQVGYSSAYSFSYSPRPGTPAAVMEQVDALVSKERLAGLQLLLDEQQHDFHKNFMGKTVAVLVEDHARSEGQLYGHSEHNLTVTFKGNKRLIGHTVRVKITETKPKNLFGEIEV